MVIAVWPKRARMVWSTITSRLLVAGVAAYLTLGTNGGGYFSYRLCAPRLAAFATEKLTVGVGSLLVGATALALLGYDAFFAAMAGTTLPELAQNVFNQPLAGLRCFSEESRGAFSNRHSLLLLLAQPAIPAWRFYICNRAFWSSDSV